MSSHSHDKELFESRPVFRSIMNLALPSIVGQIILVIYNMADTFFVGMSGSNEMLTAVTICTPAFMFLSAISNLFGIGGAGVISRSLGQRDDEKARHASSFAIWGCLAVTLLYSLGAYLFIDFFVDCLGGGNPIVHENASKYITVTVVIGGAATAMNTLLSHLIRAEGRSLEASAGIALGGILNVALDPLFMFVILDKGNEALGAGIATALSNVIALVYFIVIITVNRKKLVLSAKPTPACLGKHVPADILSTGLPACLMTLCENISYAILGNLMEEVGTTAQAGVEVAKKVNMFAHSVVRGMTQGVLPLIGYNYASGNRKRMKSVIYMSGAISLGISVLCMTVSLVFGRPLICFFNPDGGEAITYGVKFLSILCIGAPFSAAAYTVISFFQAVGKGVRSLILALLRKGILDIPLMFTLHSFYPVFGIVWATPIADILCCATAVVLFTLFIRKHGNAPVTVPITQPLTVTE